MKWVLLILTAALVVLHQDIWNWTEPKLAGDFFPVGLWYHALFCVAAAVLMALLVAFAWPKYLEDVEPQTPEPLRAEGRGGH